MADPIGPENDAAILETTQGCNRALERTVLLKGGLQPPSGGPGLKAVLERPCSPIRGDEGNVRDCGSPSSGCRAGESRPSWTDACGQGLCGITSLPRRPAPTPRSQPDADHRPLGPDRPEPDRRRPIRTGHDPLHPPRRGSRPDPGYALRPPHLLRNGEGWAVEEFTKLGTHSVTHVDAPWHYNSQIQSRRATTIDELPLEWFFADGVVLDMTHKADGEKVEVGDVKAALAGLGYSLKPLDIVLVRTGRDAFYGQPDYARRGCAVTPGATR